MSNRILPRYPVYVISKGRWERTLTARFLVFDRVPFKLVVEPQEVAAYAEEFGIERILQLPFSNLGLGSIPARNWVWEHAKNSGAERHWILDDNIQHIRRWLRGRRIPMASGPAFAAMEDFVDRYENIAIAGPNYQMFGITRGKSTPPLGVNCHVYSTLLVRNDLPFRWRGRYNEDADLCLQVLANGWCTVLFNAFLINKMTTMSMRGGNSQELYSGDGRLKMARSLERLWPGVVTVTRRYGRPQHSIDWSRFDNPLRLKADVSVDRAINEYGLKLVKV